VRKLLRDAIDDGDHLLAVLDRQAAARQEAVLHIDDDQHALLIDRDVSRREGEPARRQQHSANSTGQTVDELTSTELSHGSLP
jgi:hypothetical protein